MSEMDSQETLVVYSKPSCVQCNATYRALDSNGLKGRYRIVDLSEDPDALEYVKELGYSSAPVVVLNDNDHWAGFRPDHISRVAEYLTSQQ